MTTNTREYSRAHYAANRERYWESKRRWRAAHPEYKSPEKPEVRRLINRAHSHVVYAIKTGRLVRPDACSRCGVRGKIEAAHHDYSKPLEITWLCVRCHRQWDADHPKIKEED